MVYLVMVMDMHFRSLCNYVKISLNSLIKKIGVVFSSWSASTFILTFFDSFMVFKLSNWTCFVILYDYHVIDVSFNTRHARTFFNIVVFEISLKKYKKYLNIL